MAGVRSALFAVAVLAGAVADQPEEIDLSDEVSLLQRTAGVTSSAAMSMRSRTDTTPLTLFRDAVVQRPTPPNGYTPLPEIQMMRLKASQTPEALEGLCRELHGKLQSTPSLQEPMYIQGVHLQAMRAMRNFPDSAEVQAACTGLLADMVQWNWVLARALGDAGALDVIVAAMRRFPDKAGIRALSGALGSFCDFDIQNKEKLGHLGLVGQVYNATDANYELSDVAQMYNLWSTLCNVPELAEQMVVGHNELERGVRAMKAFRSGTVRGEVIMVHSACFMGKPAWRQRMVTAGIVPEIIDAMRDEMSGVHGELDTVGQPRLLWNALRWLDGLTSVGPEARAAMVDAGVVDAIVQALREGSAQGHGFAEMQQDVEGQACRTLSAIMVDGPRQLGPLVSAREELAELPSDCNNLLKAAL